MARGTNGSSDPYHASTNSGAAALAVAPGDTAESARRALWQTFARSGVHAAQSSANLLVQFALGIDHAELASNRRRKISADECARIHDAAARRLRHEPVAYILGRQEFWSLPLSVTTDTLIPRPDSETVVEAALAMVDRGGARDRALRVADLGTGSGALLLALLSELPNAYGIASDRDTNALAVARANANGLGLAGRASFVGCDFAAALAPGLDLVVSNPPYIETDVIETLDAEVRAHEPRLALDGGPDGLSAYQSIARQCAGLLKPAGTLVVEIGHGQAEAVTAVFAATGWVYAAPPKTDYGDIPRVLILQHH